MSKTTLLKTARFLSFVAGAALTMSGQKYLFAQLLTAPGSLVINTNLDDAIRASAPVAEQADGTLQFVMGAAFLMIALMLHALLATHKQDKVRITAKPSRAKRVTQWFLVQMKI